MNRSGLESREAQVHAQITRVESDWLDDGKTLKARQQELQFELQRVQATSSGLTLVEPARMISRPDRRKRKTTDEHRLFT